MFKKRESEPVSIKEKHYKYVLEEDYERYVSSRSSLEFKQLEIAGTTLKYIERGQGPLLLMFPGSTGKGISFYEYILDLSNRYRVVAIDYPVANSLEHLVEMIRIAVERLQVDEQPIYVLANSFGSVILQELLIKEPKLFDHVIFMHGVSKDSLVSKKVVKMNQKSINSFLKSISFLKFSSFQKRFSKRLRSSMHIYPENISLRLFWEGFYEEMLYNTTQEEMISNYTFMKDFWYHRLYSKEQFEPVKSPVIIIESFADMDAELPEKLALCSLFPSHEMLMLKGDSNLSMIKNREEIVAFIQKVLPKPVKES